MAGRERPSVYINGRFFGQRVTGVQRYARESIAGIDQLLGEGYCNDLQWTLLAPQGTPIPRFKHLATQYVGRLNGHLWEQLELPLSSRDGLLFSFGFTGPIFKRHQIVTVHDAAVVRSATNFKAQFRRGYRWLVSWVATRAPLTMTVSQFSAREATACFGVPADRLRITTEGWQHLESIAADESVLDAHGLRGRRFALAVSSPTPSKNFATIARALELLGEEAPHCVIVGAADAKVFRAPGHDHTGDTPTSLTLVGYVSDGQLKALYTHAHCFVFPSFYEGFGIPPLEAMAQGCPVIASTADAVREVCADAALYFDPSRPDRLADQMTRLFSDAVLHRQLREQGRQRAEGFSWCESARLNMQAIREAVERC